MRMELERNEKVVSRDRVQHCSEALQTKRLVILANCRDKVTYHRRLKLRGLQGGPN